MSSNPNLPNRDNGYTLPLRQWFNRQFLQPILTSIHERLTPLEAQVVDYEEAVNLITTQALATVTATLTQEIATQRAVLEEIQQQAEEILDEYQSRNIEATRVLLTAIPGLAATTAQAAIAELHLKKAALAGADFTGPVTLPAATADAPAPLTIPEGVEPTTKKNGDIWSTAAGLYARIAGVTTLFWNSSNAPDATDALVDAGTDTARRMFTIARLYRLARAALPLPSAAEIDAGTATTARSITAALLFRAARAALPAMTQAIAEAGTDIVARSVSALTLRQAAVAVDTEVLIVSYTGAQLVGTSSVTYDLPTGFSTFRVLIDAIGSNPAGSISLRCGPAGGALHAGSSDYYSLVDGQIADSAITSAPTASGISLGDLTNNSSFQAEILITDGSSGGYWKALAVTAGQVANGSYFRFGRHSFYQAAAGVRKRIGIISTQPFINSGNIRIYGVR